MKVVFVCLQPLCLALVFSVCIVTSRAPVCALCMTCKATLESSNVNDSFKAGPEAERAGTGKVRGARTRCQKHALAVLATCL